MACIHTHILATLVDTSKKAVLHYLSPHTASNKAHASTETIILESNMQQSTKGNNNQPLTKVTGLLTDDKAGAKLEREVAQHQALLTKVNAPDYQLCPWTLAILAWKAIKGLSHDNKQRV